MMIFKEDIKGLREFIEKAKKKELDSADVFGDSVLFTILITIILWFAFSNVFKNWLIIIILLITIFSFIFGLFFMKRDADNISSLVGIIGGFTVGEIVHEVFFKEEIFITPNRLIDIFNLKFYIWVATVVFSGLILWKLTKQILTEGNVPSNICTNKFHNR